QQDGGSDRPHEGFHAHIVASVLGPPHALEALTRPTGGIAVHAPAAHEQSDDGPSSFLARTEETGTVKSVGFRSCKGDRSASRVKRERHELANYDGSEHAGHAERLSDIRRPLVVLGLLVTASTRRPVQDQCQRFGAAVLLWRCAARRF